MSGRFTRRQLFGGGVALAVALAGARLEPWRALAGVEEPGDPDRLAALLGPDPGAIALGRAYLRAAPAERDAARLTERITAALPGGSAAVRDADDVLRAELWRAARRDFDEQRIVCLDGWYLAVVEARLCGLAALLHGPATA